MPGNKTGGRKARDTNLALHGEDFYRRIGQKGGQNGKKGGFFVNRELAKKAGSVGGKKSRRGSSNTLTEDDKAQIITESKLPGFFMSEAAKKHNVHVSIIKKILE